MYDRHIPLAAPIPIGGEAGIFLFALEDITAFYVYCCYIRGAAFYENGRWFPRPQEQIEPLLRKAWQSRLLHVGVG